MNDICCIGHITLDKIVTPRQTVYLPGGTSYYFSHGMACLDGGKDNYKLITRLAPSEYASADELCALGIDVEVIPSRHTVYFENTYGENQNNRSQRVLAKADPFTVDLLKGTEARYYHLGSLLADDFPPEVIPYLAARGTLSVDAQGYLREVRGEKVYPVDWEGKLEALRYIHILKVNEHEARVLTGETDYSKAAEMLCRWGVREVLLTLGSEGSLIRTSDKLYRIPAYPPQELVDATGCGDTYMLGYLYCRSRGADVARAGCFAAALSTLKLEHSGPFRGTNNQVLQIIQGSRQKAEVFSL